ncbi:hypothetical protein N7495_000394 [Penicillium taxi]|uniref:uncharacterized protein n=1 Tax=Penicillium taxi TaxID=168475 RepID=UPI002545AF71|nr:uncharacterized protein N7495_000394 [Penicillium taxi]KAJ5907712.1 hypothetical protein N7495_000394 [Penicillium taxi]
MVAPRNTAYAEESAEVEVLYANLDKLNLLTKKIRGSLVRLETSGNVVKEAIGPIYSNTQSLQITNSNIDKVNDAIDRLRQPLDAKSREEGIIRAGSGLSQYLLAMKRVEKALVDLNTTNLRANQTAIAEFNALLNTGSGKLQDLLRSQLKQHATSIEPLKRDNPSIKIYAEIRGPYITAGLQNLSIASLSTVKRRATDGPYKQGTNGIGLYSSALEAFITTEHGIIVQVFTGDQQGLALQATFIPAMADYSKTLRELNQYIKQNLMTDCFLAFEIIEIVTAMSYRIDSKTAELKTLLIEALRPVRETAKSSLSELLEETKRKAATVALPRMVAQSLWFRK